jgi:hypothetical protein
MVVGGCQISDVSRMGKNSLSHFCDCFTRVETGVSLGIVEIVKNIFHCFSRICCMDAFV